MIFNNNQYRIKVLKNIDNLFITENYLVFKNLMTLVVRVSILLYEGLYDDFLKVKSIEKPSCFYKKHNKKYKKQSTFVRDYFNNMSEEEIMDLIDLYVRKHGKTLKKNQKTLKEIIN